MFTCVPDVASRVTNLRLFERNIVTLAFSDDRSHIRKLLRHTMRFLEFDSNGDLKLSKDFTDNIPAYAILSHTWGADEDEVTFDDFQKNTGKTKAGHTKLRFCGRRARSDGLDYFWVDTCCINKANYTELSAAINSMFRWYQNAARCYVYLSDVPLYGQGSSDLADRPWQSAFRESKWFSRGWTFQELLAPMQVEFFSQEEILLGNRTTLGKEIHEITDVPVAALQGAQCLQEFGIDEKKRWASNRRTKIPEDKAYCLLGIFNVYMPLIYGEGDNAYARLDMEIRRTLNREPLYSPQLGESRSKRQNLHRDLVS